MLSSLPVAARARVRRRGAAAVAVVSCLPLALLSAPSAAAEPDSGKDVDIVFNYKTTPPTFPQPNDCAPKKRNGVDVVKISDIATQDLSKENKNYIINGTAIDISCGYATDASGGFAYEGTETANVTVEGCGTGDLAFVYFDGQSTGAPPGGTGVDGGKVRFQPGSGTGDLKGVSGTGTTQGITYPDGTTEGVVRATLHCPMA